MKVLYEYCIQIAGWYLQTWLHLCLLQMEGAKVTEIDGGIFALNQLIRVKEKEFIT